MTSVAIQGVRGSYSEEATRRIVGLDAIIVECIDFASTFDAVETKQVEFAVVPVKNKIVGEIEGTMSFLRNRHYRVLDRLPLKVMHILAGTKDAERGTVKTVRSHIEALRQCSKFLSANTHVMQVIGADTASSIRRIVDEGIAEHAAIGSRRAAEIYDAKIIAENIADDHDNWTTFYLIGK